MRYLHADDQVELAPSYGIVSTMPYSPRDIMALALESHVRVTAER